MSFNFMLIHYKRLNRPNSIYAESKDPLIYTVVESLIEK